ncbi:hypothetical protein ANMWB30_22910 [Arthrobacter sp. MWB30]|nr:hypothetical protein ANMWB30_22910 [Arthrobacter sp. MWB30]
MTEYTDDQDATSRIANHRLEALALLGPIRPAPGSLEAMTAAQVHATLALVESTTDVVRLLGLGHHELNAANMFRLAESLSDDHPLRNVIQNGLLQHMTRSGALHADVMLAVRIKELGLEVKAGDDIMVGNSEWTQTCHLLVIDPAHDEWLLISNDKYSPDTTVNSPKLNALFNEDISSLMVTIMGTAQP